MAITADTHVQLGVSKPKSDATVGTGSFTLGASEIALKVGSAVDVSNTQQIVGDFEKLHRYAKANISERTANTTYSMPLGGSDFDIAITGHGTGVLSLYVSSEVMDGDKSHFLTRTFKRLIERLLEEAK